jgi:hypothetical protein
LILEVGHHTWVRQGCRYPQQSTHVHWRLFSVKKGKNLARTAFKNDHEKRGGCTKGARKRVIALIKETAYAASRVDLDAVTKNVLTYLRLDIIPGYAMSLSTAIHARPLAFIFGQEREESCADRFQERSRKAWRLYQRRTQTGLLR